jgi:hypothetical protein
MQRMASAPDSVVEAERQLAAAAERHNEVLASIGLRARPAVSQQAA